MKNERAWFSTGLRTLTFMRRGLFTVTGLITGTAKHSACWFIISICWAKKVLKKVPTPLFLTQPERPLFWSRSGDLANLVLIHGAALHQPLVVTFATLRNTI